MSPSISPALVALTLLFALAACGGGGDDDLPEDTDGPPSTGGGTVPPGPGGPPDAPPGGTGTDPGTGTDTAGGPDPVDATGPRFTYRALPVADSAAAFVAGANAQGAEGYRFQGPATFGAGSPLRLGDPTN